MIRCEKCDRLLSWNDGNLKDGMWIVVCPECGHDNKTSYRRSVLRRPDRT